MLMVIMMQSGVRCKSKTSRHN